MFEHVHLYAMLTISLFFFNFFYLQKNICMFLCVLRALVSSTVCFCSHDHCMGNKMENAYLLN